MNYAYCLGLILSLSACSAVPDAVKPDIIYGETFGAVKHDLPKTGARISTNTVPEAVPQDTLAHVFKEFSADAKPDKGKVIGNVLGEVFGEVFGEVRHKNHSPEILKGGQSTHLPAVPLPDKKPKGTTSAVKSQFKGLSGGF